MLNNNIVLKVLLKEFAKLGNSLGSYLSPYITTYLHIFYTYKPLLILTILILLILWICYFAIKLYLSWKESNTPSTILEVIPPSSTEQSSFTTTQLFTAIHGVLQPRSFLLRIFDVTKAYSFEIVSTKDKGIRYLLRLPTDDADIIRKTLLSYLSGIQIKEAKDYVSEESSKGHIVNIKLSKHFAFPLKKQDNLTEYDPIAYITGTMTKLADDELVAVQMIVSPVSRSISRIVSRLRSLFLVDKDVITELRGTNQFESIFLLLLRLSLQILMLPLGLCIFVFTGGREGPLLPIPSMSAKLPDSTYKDIVETQIKNKIDQELFAVSLRFMTVSGSHTNRYAIERGFLAALSPFKNAGYQSLQPKRFLKVSVVHNVLHWLFRHRVHSLTGW